ncbi:unnamed protein product, partial [Lota lota]
MPCPGGMTRRRGAWSLFPYYRSLVWWHRWCGRSMRRSSEPYAPILALHSVRWVGRTSRS